MISQVTPQLNYAIAWVTMVKTRAEGGMRTKDFKEWLYIYGL